MNRKITNRLVAILNIIAIISIYVLYFSTNYLASSIMGGETGSRSIYNSFIIDTLLNNIQLIMVSVHGGIGIFNIICAIQNKENKKLCFWQLVFGIYEIWSAITIGVFLDDSDIIAWGNIFISGVIPIILAIVNLVLIKKHKPKVIQVISYIAIIILAILDLLEIIGAYWNIVAIVMQLIYIHYQDKNVVESSTRKIINIILYYILQLILAVGFFLIIISSLLTTKINEVKWKNALSELYNNISTLQGVTTKDLYIPVEKNYKYGFINESGQEKIPCEYDRVTYFNEVEINNNTYDIALTKKDNKFYILSKSNDIIAINGDLEKYLRTIDNHLSEAMTKMFNENGDYRSAYLQSFEFFFQVFTRGETKLTQQTVQTKNDSNEITLNEKNSKYSYTNKNYSMLIEPIYDETEDTDYDTYYDDYYVEDENTYYLSSESTKYNVTITKSNGEIESSIVYLPGLDGDEDTLDTFTNGYIEFENEDHTRNGWYDNNGNQTTISSNYTIKDIKDNKIILQITNNNDDKNYDINTKKELNFMIIDLAGKTLLKTTALDIYDNMYLVKNNNKKMVLMDKDLKVISNEYDKIITTMQMDISPQYSSYY